MSQHSGFRRIERALISVSDKRGLPELAAALTRHGVELLSTGGTAAALRDLGHTVRDVAQVTDWPEMMDGRVKTLHPRIHGGLLAVRGKPAHQDALAAHSIPPIDLLVVNLYPFELTRAAGADFATTLENIDIGGPAMIRAAAKNHRDVAVLVDPDDYRALIAYLGEPGPRGGGTNAVFRQRLAASAFARTATYDASVSDWLAAETGEAWPRRRAFAGTLAQELRYGENPGQGAALYATAPAVPGVVTARQIQGKALSFNNIADADAALALVAEFPAGQPAVVIVKHANPCGAAVHDSLKQAHALALQCDPVSAFGGIVALNSPLDEATAKAVLKVFTEVVIAPDASPEALNWFASKPNIRLLLTGALPAATGPGLDVRSVAGGLLVQERDRGTVSADQLKVVTKRAPADAELADMLFAFRVAKHAKSNAIVFAAGGRTLAIGAGQPSRLDATANAVRKAGTLGTSLAGCVVASDAFYPFPDGLVAAAEAGATAVIQPGGSLKDADVIAAADQLGLAMVVTGRRHFRH